MARTNFMAMSCSIARSLGVIGETWTPLIIRDVYVGLNRFDDLVADLGIARNVLSDRLGGLVEAGVLRRRPYRDTGRTRYEYELTSMGRDLCPILMALMGWGDRWLAGDQGPPMRLTHRDCGHTTDPVVACSHCRATLAGDDVTVRPGPGGRRAAGTSRIADFVCRSPTGPVNPDFD